MFRRPHEKFFDECIRRIVTEKPTVLDIGGGLRLSRVRSNRIDHRHAWINDLVAEHRVHYRVLDYVDTYHPDLVGDIQRLPLPDASGSAIVCLSVLEHVENPFLAADELYRVLRPGGYCLIYVPFLFYYHAERNYYKDYWRFTEDSLQLLFNKFSSIELQSTRGPFETLVRLSPLGRWSAFCTIGFVFDSLFHKLNSKQTSGYNVMLVK